MTSTSLYSKIWKVSISLCMFDGYKPINVQNCAATWPDFVKPWDCWRQSHSFGGPLLFPFFSSPSAAIYLTQFTRLALMENSSQCKWRPEDAWNQRVKVPGNSPGYYYSNHKDHLFVIDSLDLNTCPVDLWVQLAILDSCPWHIWKGVKKSFPSSKAASPKILVRAGASDGMFGATAPSHGQPGMKRMNSPFFVWCRTEWTWKATQRKERSS